jgi:hypothetical protein
MGTVFISYRRSDSTKDARALYERLRRDLHDHTVFIDLESIDPGEDFTTVIDKHLEGCNALVVLIGKEWLGSHDARGTSRVSDPADFVRMELETALRRDIPVFPVLLDGASMPSSHDLPAALQPLLRRQTIELDYARFDGDVERLAKAIRKVLLRFDSSASDESRLLRAGHQSRRLAAREAGFGAAVSAVRRVLLLYAPANALGWLVRVALYLALSVTVVVSLFPDDAEMSFGDRVVTVLFWGSLVVFMSWCGGLIEPPSGVPVARQWARRAWLLYWPRQRAARLVHVVFYVLATVSAGGAIFLASEWLSNPELMNDADFIGVLAGMGIPGALALLTRAIARRLDTR